LFFFRTSPCLLSPWQLLIFWITRDHPIPSVFFVSFVVKPFTLS
jgi:hypothetical protein